MLSRAGPLGPYRARGGRAAVADKLPKPPEGPYARADDGFDRLSLGTWVLTVGFGGERERSPKPKSVDWLRLDWLCDGFASMLDFGVDGREGTREGKLPVTGEVTGGVGVRVGNPPPAPLTGAALSGAALSGELLLGGAPNA